MTDILHTPLNEKIDYSPEKRGTYELEVVINGTQQKYTIISQSHLNLDNPNDKDRLIELIQRDLNTEETVIEVNKIINFYPYPEQ